MIIIQKTYLQALYQARNKPDVFSKLMLNQAQAGPELEPKSSARFTSLQCFTLIYCCQNFVLGSFIEYEKCNICTPTTQS